MGFSGYRKQPFFAVPLPTKAYGENFDAIFRKDKPVNDEKTQILAVGNQVGSRFDYVKYDEKAVAAQNELKQAFTGVEALLEQHFPVGSRSKALIMTKLEEAYMWIGKTIRDDQIRRNGSAELQEERNVG